MARVTEEEFRKILADNPQLRVIDGPGQGAAHSVTRAIVKSESEADFQDWLIKELQDNGWRVHAERKARSKKGWITPVQGSPGFPDIFAVRPPRALVIENKSDDGAASPEQISWLLLLGQCPSLEVKCWSPKDRAEILTCIK